MPPPPTANLQRPHVPQQPVTPQRLPQNVSSPQAPSPPAPPRPVDAPSAEFAPNAFDLPESTKQFSAAPATTFTQTHWYDRILDALLGEDETQPKNRLALICAECRLVNGQAPPGTRNLEDIGRWRCSGCRAWNGTEKPHEQIAGLVQGLQAERKAKEMDSFDGGIDDDDTETQYDGGATIGADEDLGVEVEMEEDVEETLPSRSTRSKTKGKGRK
jgi:hypothetical protein